MNKLIAATIALASLVGCASPSQKGLDSFNAGNYQHAANTFMACAQQGDSYCMNNLGYMFETGAVTPNDGLRSEEGMLNWYTASAQRGNPTAIANLTRLGLPVPEVIYQAPAPAANNDGLAIIALGLLNGAAAYQEGTYAGQSAARDTIAEDRRARELNQAIRSLNY